MATRELLTQASKVLAEVKCIFIFCPRSPFFHLIMCLHNEPTHIKKQPPFVTEKRKNWLISVHVISVQLQVRQLFQ